MTELAEMVEFAKTCEPKYADMPREKKVVALMTCLKSGKARNVIGGVRGGGVLLQRLED